MLPDIKASHFRRGRRGFLRSYTANFRSRRAHPQFTFKIFKLVRCPDPQNFYSSVIQVARPAPDTQLPCGLLNKISIAYSLDMTRNIVFASDR